MTNQSEIESEYHALRARKTTSRELVDEALQKIARLDKKLNAFITVTGDLARAAADELDRELAAGNDRGVLHGIPIAHKDLMRTKGVRTTAGSRIFADYIPRRDADVVRILRDAGTVSLGKTGLHELAYGVTSNNPHYGAIHNPWDLKRIPGGSSGGSAVAVAAGIVPFATGTDTGGSIRVPASFCGIVGFKPTFGKISIAGVLPLGITQDHVGPMTRTVRDAAIAYQAMAIHPTGYVPPQQVSLAGVRVGVPRNYFFERVNAEVASSVKSAIEAAGRAGGRLTFPIWSRSQKPPRRVCFQKRRRRCVRISTGARTSEKKCWRGSTSGERFWHWTIWKPCACAAKSAASSPSCGTRSIVCSRPRRP